MPEILITYFHYFSFLVLFAALVTEHLWTKNELNRKDALRLRTIDTIYGIATLVVIGTGIFKIFVVGKPSLYYFNNWCFFVKMGLFVVIGLLSLWPTWVILKNSRLAKKSPETATFKYPSSLKNILRLELLLIALIPLFAILMARGIGMLSM